MSQDSVEIRSLDGSHVRTWVPELEHLDWTPGCEWECERRATGLDACHWCPDGDSLMCDEHHMEFIAYIAENLGAGTPLACEFCDHELHSTADRDWRPL